MIHPDTELKYINELKGRGIIATNHIPKGTVTYVKDKLEIIIAPDDERQEDPNYKDIIDTYTYTDSDGSKVLSWDTAKYVNHCCQFNTISTGYGFEIAVRDIHTGEELTDDYGLFNLNKEMKLKCNLSPCRKTVNGYDINNYHRQWDNLIKEALQKFNQVKQPLVPYLDPDTIKSLQDFLDHGKNYKSVLELKYLKPRS
jgi:uncharacterized protein